MIFGFGRKNAEGGEEHDDEAEDVDFVLFQGALNGKEANLNANARLAQAGLIPAKEMITDAILRRADQIRVEPKGDRSVVQLSIDGVFCLAGGAALVVYVGLRLLLLTSFGRIIVGIRESERRMELMGFDSRRYKLATFVLAAGIAALSGALYAIWGNFVAPEMFNLNQAAQVVIWVIVGGRSTLIGPVVATGVVQYLSNWLGTVSVGQVSVVLGFILLVFVLIFPRGLLPSLGDLLIFLTRRDGKKRA